MSETLAETIGRTYRAAQDAIASEQFEQARSALESLLPLLVQADDRPGQIRVLDELGQVHELLGDLANARRSYESALERLPVDSGSTRVLLLHRLAHACRPSNPTRSRVLFLECASLADALGDRRAAALSRAMVGQIDITSGDSEGGMTLLLTALVDLPPDAAERSHLIEHAAYLSEQLPRSVFQRLLESHVPPGPIALALVSALAERPSRR